MTRVDDHGRGAGAGCGGGALSRGGFAGVMLLDRNAGKLAATQKQLAALGRAETSAGICASRICRGGRWRKRSRRSGGSTC